MLFPELLYNWRWNNHIVLPKNWGCYLPMRVLLILSWHYCRIRLWPGASRLLGSACHVLQGVLPDYGHGQLWKSHLCLLGEMVAPAHKPLFVAPGKCVAVLHMFWPKNGNADWMVFVFHVGCDLMWFDRLESTTWISWLVSSLGTTMCYYLLLYL